MPVAMKLPEGYCPGGVFEHLNGYLDVFLVIVRVKYGDTSRSSWKAGVYIEVVEEMFRMSLIRVKPRRDQHNFVYHKFRMNTQVLYKEAGTGTEANQYCLGSN